MDIVLPVSMLLHERGVRMAQAVCGYPTGRFVLVFEKEESVVW